MNRSYSESYKASGVDITAGYRAVDLMKEHVQRTRTTSSLDEIGGFGGCVSIAGEDGDVLVSGTDGVGTKLKLAFALDRHDTVGRDCVAMCVNDIICTGARPLLFLDYIACGRNVPEKIASIVKGVADGCVEAGCPLVGGETAEMPGFYPEDEYDLAGFSVGIVRRERMLDRSRVKEGDLVLALPSSGVHSNGFSLVRRVFDIDAKPEKLARKLGDGRTLGEALLEPTRIYVRAVLDMVESTTVHSLAHITGGGFYENIPRALGEGCMAVIEKASLRTPEVFHLIQEEGSIPERDMYNTFNMGVGMVAIIPPSSLEEAVQAVPDSYVIGRVEHGDGGVELV